MRFDRELALVACFVLVACGGSGGSPDAAADTGTPPADAGLDTSVADAGGDAGGPFGEPITETPGGGAGCCDHEVGLALGSDGEPRMVGTNDRDIWFSVRSGGTWTEESTGLRTAFATEGTALAIGSDDVPHLLFVPSDELHYATRDASGTWTSQRVGDMGTVSARNFSHFDLALDASNAPHAVFLDADTSTLMYAAWNGTGFDLSVIEAPAAMGDQSGEFARLTVGGDDSVHVSYLAVVGDTEMLRYAVGPASWAISDVAGSGKGVHGTVLLDSGGRPHIVSTDLRSSRSRGIYWSRLDGGAWSETEIHPDVSVVDMDAALDPSDQLHVFMSESTLGEFGDWVYYRFDGTAFDSLRRPRPEVPPGSFDPGPSNAPASVSIAVDDASDPHLASPFTYTHF